jgi:hypothetical protein
VTDVTCYIDGVKSEVGVRRLADVIRYVWCSVCSMRSVCTTAAYKAKGLHQQNSLPCSCHPSHHVLSPVYYFVA